MTVRKKTSDQGRDVVVAAKRALAKLELAVSTRRWTSARETSVLLERLLYRAISYFDSKVLDSMSCPYCGSRKTIGGLVNKTNTWGRYCQDCRKSFPFTHDTLKLDEDQ